MRYVIGDIHGCYKTLVSLLDHRLNLQKRDEFYFVGDFIDRGPGSRQVIDFLFDLRQEGYQVFPVRGNHEEMLLDAWTNPTADRYMLWMMNGAEQTLISYDIPSHRFMDEACLNELPEDHLDFLRGMPYYIELEDYIIVHAGINFRSEAPFKDTRAMVWCRDCSNDPAQSGNRIIVSGHTPTPLDQIRKGVKRRGLTEINIDAGCVYKDFAHMGHLVALDLDNLTLYWEENIDF